MASSKLARKVFSTASCFPFRSASLRRVGASDTMEAVSGPAKARTMASAAQELASHDKGSDIAKSGDIVPSQERYTPYRAFDLMDSVFPMRNMRSMIDAMDRIFDDPFFSRSPATRESSVGRRLRTPWDFVETEDTFRMRLDMPGFSKEEVKVVVEDGSLMIKAEQKVENKSAEDRRTSWSHGSYASRIMLPENVNVEQIKAEMKNGVLTVSIPKVKEDLKKNAIDVQIE